jgi:hypothetical protein
VTMTCLVYPIRRLSAVSFQLNHETSIPQILKAFASQLVLGT